jgi:Tol biopolymer transport system component
MSAAANRPASVFISYSRADSTVIDHLEAELISYGFKTWVDRKHLEGGDKWAAKIEQAIQRCDVVVVGLTPDAVASPWVTNELYYAQNLKKPIIPVLLRPVEQIPLMLAALQYIDMEVDESQGLQQLRVCLLRMAKQSIDVASVQSNTATVTVVQRMAHANEQPTDDSKSQLVTLPDPAPATDLNDLFIQAIKARANNDLDQAEALLQQIVTRDARFGNSVPAQQLEEIQNQLLPIQLARLRKQAMQAEAQGSWGEAVSAWQAFLEREQGDIEARAALERDKQNRDSEWLYINALTLAQQKDRVAFRQMWQLLVAHAPSYGDPNSIAYLNSDPGTLLFTCQGHTNEIWSVVWSPDGQHLATASDDHTAKVWDTVTGKPVLTLYEHSGRVLGIAWSPDGQCLATSDRTVQIWNAADATRLAKLRNYRAFVWGVAWSPDGQRLATASDDMTARVWDATNGRYLLKIVGHTDHVRHVAWSPDGQYLATASNDKTACVWDAATGNLLATFQSHTSPVYCVSWSPDGRRLATASGDRSVCIWSAKSSMPLLTCHGHRNVVWSVAWSPDGQCLATASSDQTARVWDATNGKLLLTIEGHANSVNTVAWSPDGQRIATASADGTAKVWRV